MTTWLPVVNVLVCLIGLYILNYFEIEQRKFYRTKTRYYINLKNNFRKFLYLNLGFRIYLVAALVITAPLQIPYLYFALAVCLLVVAALAEEYLNKIKPLLKHDEVEDIDFEVWRTWDFGCMIMATITVYVLKQIYFALFYF